MFFIDRRLHILFETDWSFYAGSWHIRNVPIIYCKIVFFFSRYGRKTIFYISAVAQLILSTSIAFVTNYYLFLVLSMLYGVFGSAGSYITAFVLGKCSSLKLWYM